MNAKSKAAQLVEEARKKNAEAAAASEPDMSDLDALLGDINGDEGGPVTTEGNSQGTVSEEEPKLFATTIEDAPLLAPTVTEAPEPPAGATPAPASAVPTTAPEPSSRFKTRTEMELEAGRKALAKHKKPGN